MKGDLGGRWIVCALSHFGAALPLIAILLPSAELRIPVAFVAVLFGLAVTYGIGQFLGTTVA